MGGKRIHSIRARLKKVKAVKTWQLLLIFILLCFVSATLLRLDHIKMTNLRSAVLEADKESNEVTLAESLNELRDFAFNNIIINVVDDNGSRKLEFGTGVFYLEQSYLNAASEALRVASEAEIDDSNPNGNIYALASAACRPLAIANGWSWNSPEHIACYQAELAKYPAEEISGNTVQAQLPSTELYRREFVSPIWAPTISGFVIFITLVLGVVIFIRFLIWIILEIALNYMKIHKTS